MAIRLIMGLTLAVAALPALAAPLDALLSALPELSAPAGFIELGSDHMNQGLDVFRVRDSDPKTAGTKSGDYSGLHIAAGLPLADGFWLSAALWHRAISGAVDTYQYSSWQIAAQYRVIDGTGTLPAVALRLSAWGNRAAQTESSTPVRVPGAILNTVRITEPADRQLQADVIGSWRLSAATDVSVVLGAGSTQLSYGALSATTTRNGCDYQLTFTGNDIFGVLAAPCSATGGVISQFYDRSGDYGVDVANEIAWRGSFVQAGANAAWRDGPWTLRAGYLLHAVRRQAVDAIVVARGGQVHTRNQAITLEGNYRVRPGWSIFARTQLSTNLFFNDIPVTYNSSTSERFGSRYSLFTVGLRAEL